MTRATRGLALAAAFGIAFAAPSARAQIRASELGTVSQVVDGTRLTVEYSRPRARGRTTVFGTRAVQWSEVWTPGANYATTFDASRDVKVNGRAVKKGKYSVWLVVRERGDWTMVLDPRPRLFHMEHPDSTAAQIRFPVRAETAPFTDVLTWSFPALRANGATLAMAWETRRVAVDVEVTPSLAVGLPPADAPAYVGRYRYVWQDSGDKRDTVAFQILYENGTLKGEWTPNDPYMRRFALIRVAPDVFTAGIYDESGVVYEVLRPDMMFTFSRAAGRAASLEVRDDRDALIATARRLP